MRGILIFILIFGLLVFVHEFGHFWVAKKSGILVREFSIGMGPKLFQTMHHETAYTIRWLPLGGYVRLAGPDDAAELAPGTRTVLALNDEQIVTRIDDSESDLPIAGVPVQVVKADLVHALTITGYENGDESVEKTYHVSRTATIIDQHHNELVIAPWDRQFQQANIWQKLGTNVAGPLMNIVLGFVVFMIWTFVAVGPSTTTIQKVNPGSPADRAGLVKNDRIVAINQHKIDDFNEIGNLVAANGHKSMQVKVVRHGQTKTFAVTPHKVKVQGQTTYQLGILAKPDNSASAKLKRGWQTSVQTTGMIFNAVGGLFKSFSLNKLSGPVGIYSATAQVSKLGLASILAFLGMISINLGIVNLIPIPGLDGGKLLLNIIELVRGKPIKEEHEAVIDLIGVGILLLLIIAVTGNDIYRYFIK
ncbi:MAG: RIP metalloprotease RseP [Lactobacillus sp.]|jgi:regulator of sigma E protease|nr:RIP metalloprotease RseP [Lactobacillus sp.]MCH4069025.1 RIP metalloprotease RseP [Lactobacillus sp.]MCI1303427.1 RIP metalloprotease RseP [Lactobacillus sp.]MCI1329503.1 RIP metalloprotease RseP [Lactobacillus sp.]MCI1359432.1 RIP metalloprotease RseP [Lactobacillus sp.]